MISIDKLCYVSGLRYVNASVKAVYTVLTIILCILSRSLVIALVVLFVNGYLNICKGGISIRRYVKLMLIPTAFLLLSTIAVIVNITSAPMNAFALPIGNIYLTGSYASLLHGLQLILTALASVSCLYFLSLNTTMTDLLEVFRQLHCPRLITELMLLIYRFIFVLSDIASAVTDSQHARLGNRDFKTSVKSFGMLCSSLLILAVKQSGEIYDAMESRCYNGTIYVLSEHHKMEFKHVIFLTLFEFILIIIMLGEQFWL